MRILVVCHRFPFPPKRGGKIRPFNIISHLHKSHEVHVASLAHDDIDAHEAAGIKDHCSGFICEQPAPVLKWLRMLLRVPTRTPSAMGYFHSPRLHRKIRALARDKPFDLVLVHCAFVAPYVVDLPATKIMDFGDMDSQKWLAYGKSKPFPLSWVYRLEGTKMAALERRLASRFDACSTTTAAEHDTLLAMNSANQTSWFPNGVDHGLFSPEVGRGQYDPDKIVFVGRMDYFPNQQAVQAFVADIFPLIRQQRPQASFTVVGANPPASIQQLGNDKGVTVTGTVPDVREYVANASVTVAPLAIARGIQNKILESMALGVPVVASPAAANGIDARAPEHLLVADGAAEFAAQVLRVLTNPAERARLSGAGREQVIRAHSWPASMNKLDSLLNQSMQPV